MALQSVTIQNGSRAGKIIWEHPVVCFLVYKLQLGDDTIPNVPKFRHLTNDRFILMETMAECISIRIRKFLYIFKYNVSLRSIDIISV